MELDSWLSEATDAPEGRETGTRSDYRPDRSPVQAIATPGGILFLDPGLA
jgi:hypothetical protein